MVEEARAILDRETENDASVIADVARALHWAEVPL